MRDSIHSILRSAALLLLVGVIFLGCNEIPTPTAPDLSLAEGEGLTSEASASKHGKHKVSDMNDRFAGETTGANGFGRVVLTQFGTIEIDRVKVLRLLPNHTYELKVTTCTPFPCAPAIVYTSGPVTTDKHGNFLIDDFSLGAFAPAIYRVDLFVTHTHEGEGGINPLLDGLLVRDPLLACQPAFRVEVK